jgi:hypothetical protein
MDVEHRVKLVRRHVLEVFVPPDTGVVDHRVDGAEALERALDDRLAAFGRGDGMVRGDRLASRRLDLAYDGLGRRSIGTVEAGKIVDDDLGAAPSQVERVGTTRVPAQPQ